MNESSPVTATADQAERVLRECLIGFEEVRFRVTGSCMSPTIREGDVVVVAAVARRPPGFGDVVLVRQPEGLRLHRLVWPMAALGRPFRTKGDRAPLLDRPLLREAALGTVVAVDGPDGPRPARSRLRAIVSLAAAMVGRARRERHRSPR